MININLISDDLYFILGFKSLFSPTDKNSKLSFSILDDGMHSLYLIDTTCRSRRKPPSYELLDYFLERVRLVIPRNVTPEELKAEVTSFCEGNKGRLRLTKSQRVVMREIALGIPTITSQKKLRMSYKAWHSFKAAGFKRLGVKNNVTFVRAIHIWRNKPLLIPAQKP